MPAGMLLQLHAGGPKPAARFLVVAASALFQCPLAKTASPSLRPIVYQLFRLNETLPLLSRGYQATPTAIGVSCDSASWAHSHSRASRDCGYPVCPHE